MNKVVISTGKKEYNILDPVNIIYLISDGAYTYIHLFNNEKYFTSKCLKTIETELNSGLFFRINHNILINIRHIKKYKCSQSFTVTMINGSELTVSRRKKKIFKEKMYNYFKHI